MELNVLSDNVLNYGEVILKFINGVLKKVISSKYTDILDEEFLLANPSIQLSRDGYTIYLQFTINDKYFGLWCKDLECEEYDDPSEIIKSLMEENLFNKIYTKIYNAANKYILNNLPDFDEEDFKIELDPYSIHITMTIPYETEEDLDQPEMPSLDSIDIDDDQDLNNPYLTRFEYTKLISERAKMLEETYDTPLIDLSTIPYRDRIDAGRIAIAELEQKVFPLDLIRRLPNNRKIIMNPNNMIYNYKIKEKIRT